MSNRACKEIINEDLVAKLRELQRQVRSFEDLMDKIDALGEVVSAAIYEEATGIDTTAAESLGIAIQAYAVLRLRVANEVE